jgi:hypothetical protein
MLRPYRAFAAVLSAGVLVGAAAWFGEGGEGAHRARPSSPMVRQAPVAPSAPDLTDAQVKRALLREGDLGDSWGTTQGAATWRDGLLKGEADRPECQELLDAVYAENLLGRPGGGTAVAGFDDTEREAQVRYQVGVYERTDVDAKIDQVGQLAGECGDFTVERVGGQTYEVHVEPVELPGIGEARQALRMTVSGEIGEGAEGALTLDVVAVRVGDGAALLTHGGLYGIDENTTQQAVQLGAQRLRDVLADKSTQRADAVDQGNPQGNPQDY